MSVLVTGATGFVGSAVLRQLIAAGYRVRAIVRPSSDLRNLGGLPVETIQGDLTDRPSLERALDGCRSLFHVAADYRLWAADPAEIYRNNVDGTRNIMLAAVQAGVQRIVYTSSVATLGQTDDGTSADETTAAGLDDMIGHYKRSKFLAEQEVRTLAREHGLPAVIVNPAAPLGPRDIRPTPTGRIILDAARGRMPAYVDTGLNIVHVDDVAAGHLLAYERGAEGECYILGAENMSLRHILREVASLVGRRPPRVKLPHGAALALALLAEAWAKLSGRQPAVTLDGVRLARKPMYFSSTKAMQALGYAPRPAALAIRDSVRWFREHGYL
ncbi:MAG: NAD-dependent epimerase/dehydratase family protein [Gammaproteobacteria bacterium]|nr:NAD-dependent epimerase/dehydratase family protein [Gammaproteobacteria bacterium]